MNLNPATQKEGLTKASDKLMHSLYIKYFPLSTEKN